MSFLSKLFGKNKEPQAADRPAEPDNTKLNFLLNNWADNPSNENYKAVLDEIQEGNSWLLLPSVNNNDDSNGWKTAGSGSTLELTTVYNLDGLKVLGAFSSEQALTAWSKRSTEYTGIRTQDVVAFCKENNIDRIVINSDQKNMFVLERNRQNIKSRVIEEETKVLIGTPTHPLDKRIIAKLVDNFRKVDTIEEAYQYAQHLDGETSLVLAVKMSVVSDNSRAALHNAINTALDGETLHPLDIMILETEEWLQTARNVTNSFIYRRS